MAYMGGRAVSEAEARHGRSRPAREPCRLALRRAKESCHQGDHSMGGGRALKIRGVHKKRAGFAVPATPLNLSPETQTAPQGRRAQVVRDGPAGPFAFPGK